MQLKDQHRRVRRELLLASNREMNHGGEEERRELMPNNPYMFNGSRTAPASFPLGKKGKGGSRRNRRRNRKNRTRKNRKNY